MRIVNALEELPEQMERAISEAVAAFGDGSVFIEKYVGSPRHIEIQVLADMHGNIVHLFERECSVQRRHQKVVEEAPSAVLTPKIRKAMGEAAVKVAKACDYVGAGTVEFLLDENKNFYFLEMNTRLQVEHPVTELISGVDLVEQQIKVARGEKLQFKQEDLKITGHALEIRVYAEDSLDNFMPSIGTLSTYKKPSGAGIRLDDGFEEGMEVPIHYDPMISKLITYGKNREEAIQLMIKAIGDYKIEGISTTLPFGKFVCEHEAFTSGNFDTHFVKNYYSPEQLKTQYKKEKEIAAMVGLKLYLGDKEKLKTPNSSESEWQKNRA
jgi:propionyl-CoA carboxylase alpha chain